MLEIDKQNWEHYIQNSDLDSKPEFEDGLTVHWWLDKNISTDILMPLLTVFGKIQPWTEQSKGLRSFGDTETNDISICFDDITNQVEEVSCRLDLRQIDKIFLSNIFSFAIEFECLLMDKQGSLFEPNITELFNKVQLSNANRFVSDPRQFIIDFSNKIVTPE